jgi:acetyltransferase-like isoleucine patch superfamily enzyme
MGKTRNILVAKEGNLQIDQNVMFLEFCSVMVGENGRLEIGQNVFFNNYCSINCLGHLQIGENTIFGEGVKIYDHNHLHAVDEAGKLNIEPKKFKIGTVKIGKDSWIGSNVTILKDVEIGDNVIIGANCLIHKSVPSNTIIKLDQTLASWRLGG